MARIVHKERMSSSRGERSIKQNVYRTPEEGVA